MDITTEQILIIVVSIFLICYISQNNIPIFIKNIFENQIFQVLIFIFIVYRAQTNFISAILYALIFLYIINYLNNSIEKFANNKILLGTSIIFKNENNINKLNIKHLAIKTKDNNSNTNNEYVIIDINTMNPLVKSTKNSIIIDMTNNKEILKILNNKEVSIESIMIMTKFDNSKYPNIISKTNQNTVIPKDTTVTLRSINKNINSQVIKKQWTWKLDIIDPEQPLLEFTL